MPSSAHERIDRLTRHLSASGAGATTRSPMAAQLASHARPPITSHALDTATGKPARGLPLKLEQLGGALGRGWLVLGATITDDDGRAPGLLVPGTVSCYFELLIADELIARYGVVPRSGTGLPLCSGGTSSSFACLTCWYGAAAAVEW